MDKPKKNPGNDLVTSNRTSASPVSSMSLVEAEAYVNKVCDIFNAIKAAKTHKGEEVLDIATKVEQMNKLEVPDGAEHPILTYIRKTRGDLDEYVDFTYDLDALLTVLHEHASDYLRAFVKNNNKNKTLWRSQKPSERPQLVFNKGPNDYTRQLESYFNPPFFY